MRRQTNLPNDRGSVLLITLAALLMMVTAAVATLSSQLSHSSRYEQERYQETTRRLLAESGIHRALATIRHGGNVTQPLAEVWPAGRFVVEIKPTAPEQWQLVALGYTNGNPDAALRIEATAMLHDGRLSLVAWQERSMYGNK